MFDGAEFVRAERKTNTVKRTCYNMQICARLVEHTHVQRRESSCIKHWAEVSIKRNSVAFATRLSVDYTTQNILTASVKKNQCLLHKIQLKKAGKLKNGFWSMTANRKKQFILNFSTSAASIEKGKEKCLHCYLRYFRKISASNS